MGNFGEPFHWRLAVVEDVAERAGEHLLEADGEHAVGAAERDELARKIERGRARRAVVVDVDDRNTGAADAVDCRLARGRIAVDIRSDEHTSALQSLMRSTYPFVCLKQ